MDSSVDKAEIMMHKQQKFPRTATKHYQYDEGAVDSAETEKYSGEIGTRYYDSSLHYESFKENYMITRYGYQRYVDGGAIYVWGGS